MSDARDRAVSQTRSLGQLIMSMSALAVPAGQDIPAHGPGDRDDWTDRDWLIYAAGIQAAGEAILHWAKTLEEA